MTLQLAGVAVAMALVISALIGIPGGLAPGRWPDRLAFYVSSVFISLPNFWFGIVLTLLLSVKLGWLPAIGYGGFAYTLLPAFVLAVRTVAGPHSHADRIARFDHAGAVHRGRRRARGSAGAALSPTMRCATPPCRC